MVLSSWQRPDCQRKAHQAGSNSPRGEAAAALCPQHMHSIEHIHRDTLMCTAGHTHHRQHSHSWGQQCLILLPFLAGQDGIPPTGSKVSHGPLPCTNLAREAVVLAASRTIDSRNGLDCKGPLKPSSSSPVPWQGPPPAAQQWGGSVSSRASTQPLQFSSLELVPVAEPGWRELH